MTRIISMLRRWFPSRDLSDPVELKEIADQNERIAVRYLELRANVMRKGQQRDWHTFH